MPELYAIALRSVILKVLRYILQLGYDFYSAGGTCNVQKWMSEYDTTWHTETHTFRTAEYAALETLKLDVTENSSPLTMSQKRNLKVEVFPLYLQQHALWTP